VRKITEKTTTNAPGIVGTKTKRGQERRTFRKERRQREKLEGEKWKVTGGGRKSLGLRAEGKRTKR
jgi:hypothetical protein